VRKQRSEGKEKVLKEGKGKEEGEEGKNQCINLKEKVKG